MAHPSLATPRIWAWLIDLVICAGVGTLVGPLGWIMSPAYWLIRDGLFQGQSIGKRLIGLKVVTGARRARCTVRVSVIRNLLWVIPFVDILMGVTGLYHLFHDADGRHWGDRLADTRVVRA